MKNPAECPDCGNQAKAIGAIPDTNTFAGKMLDTPLSGGYLWRCSACSLGFRFPQLSKQQLDQLYAKGSDFNWNAPPTSRQDWCTARDWLKSFLPPQSRILDIGCFDGGFLAPLVHQHDCYGIEIHPIARTRAEEKGINILSNDFSKIKGEFDLITAFDIVEHIKNPADFLEQVANALRPSGLLIISTGNLDSRSFRLLRSRYWYCTIAEHISFISPLWLTKKLECLKLKIIQQKLFSHATSNIAKRASQTANNLLYHTLPAGFRTMRKLGFGGIATTDHPQLADHPPNWSSARDHFISLMQKS